MPWASRIELDRARCIYIDFLLCIYFNHKPSSKDGPAVPSLSESIVEPCVCSSSSRCIHPIPSHSLIHLHPTVPSLISSAMPSCYSSPLMTALQCCSIHLLCALFRMLLPPRLSFDCMREFGCLIGYSSTLQDLQMMLIRMQYRNRGEGPAYFVCREYGRAPFVVDERHWARKPPPTRMASHNLAFIL
jgi:hypothetical protein